ncbi:WD40 repeat domain-containing protein [Magnetococcales bacterium HHB-1]
MLAWSKPALRLSSVLQFDTHLSAPENARLTVNHQGDRLLTASYRHGVQLWNAKTGQWIKDFSPPQKNHRFKIATLSPDGRHVAASGLPQIKADSTCNQQHTIYLFDTTTGEVAQQIRGLPAPASFLLFSPNSQLLVVLLTAPGGMHVYQVENGEEVFEDLDYTAPSYGADYAPSGKLVTASRDGFIRLYGLQLQLLAKRKMDRARLPHRIRFSPQEKTIAVGFADKPLVALLSPLDLAPVYYPKTDQSQHSGNLAFVAWSKKSKKLYAGGDRALLHAWSWFGKGKTRTHRILPDGELLDLQPQKKGGLFFLANKPPFGLLNRQLKQTLHAKKTHQDKKEAIKTAQKKTQNASQTEKLNITDWRHSTTPKLNGRPLTLAKYETSKAILILPDKKGFILAASWNIYRFDRLGNKLWRTPVSKTPWSIALLKSKTEIAVQFGDGSKQSYAIENGQKRAQISEN